MMYPDMGGLSYVELSSHRPQSQAMSVRTVCSHIVKSSLTQDFNHLVCLT